MQVILEREATMRDAVTVEAVRTPNGEEKPSGALAGLHATITERL